MLEENETRARSDQGAGEVDARALSRLLRAEVSDGNPDAFGENVEVLLSLAMEGGEEAPLSVAEIKTLLRHLARRFEERSGNRIFSLGVYQTFFPWIRARRSSSGPGGSMGEGLENPLGLLAQICSLLRNEALTVQTLRPILLRLWGQLCEGIPAREAGLPDGRMLAWRLFEAILRGLLSVETFSTAERSFHYGVLCPSSRLEAALQ
ncbi:MAG: hypothetical protein RBU30_17610, partial [Polyangia bacterium]|nr:hypothetical protein [Polyangia bacterium]